MKVIKETIGNTAVLIQTVDEVPEVLGSSEEGPAVFEAGISDKLRSVYKDLKSVITDFATDVGQDLNEVAETLRPNQVEMEFNIGISAEGQVGVGSILVFGSKGEYAFKVKMIWELKKPN